MATVKLLIAFSGSVDGNSNPNRGDIIEVHDHIAKRMIEQGYAEKAKKKKEKETASKSAPEAAMQPKAEPREETFECDECGRSFDSPQGLGSHSRVHAG